ncbi:hypothetical protein I4U23_005978, partial [Adineta vaga]
YRKWSNRHDLTYKLASGCVIFWLIFFGHRLILYSIINGKCIPMPGIYATFDNYIEACITAMGTPIVMIILGILILRSVREITHRHINLGNPSPPQRTIVKQTLSQQIDTQLTVMLLVQLSIALITRIPYATYLIYLNLTQNQKKSPYQIAVESITSENNQEPIQNPRHRKLSHRVIYIITIIIASIVILSITITCVVVFSKNKNSSEMTEIVSLPTMTSSSINMSSTTTTLTPARYEMCWSFPSSVSDICTTYQGNTFNNASIVSPGYADRGIAASFQSRHSQYFIIPYYLNMTYTNFTWQMWIYPINLSTTNITTDRWHHLAFVYNYSNRVQYLYLNGMLDCIGLSRTPFLATQAYIAIGSSYDPGPTGFTSFWDGLIGSLSYISRLKDAKEILTDATLIASYPFDRRSTNFDSGPNRIHGLIIGEITFVNGRVNQAIQFNRDDDIFQISALTPSITGNRAYSFALWIKKHSIDGIILYMSSETLRRPSFIGPIIPLNT